MILRALIAFVGILSLLLCGSYVYESLPILAATASVGLWHTWLTYAVIATDVVTLAIMLVLMVVLVRTCHPLAGMLAALLLTGCAAQPLGPLMLAYPPCGTPQARVGSQCIIWKVKACGTDAKPTVGVKAVGCTK